MTKNIEDEGQFITPSAQASVNININLKELPKCPHCDGGTMMPLSYTDYSCTHVFNYGWMCSKCYKGWMWIKGVLTATTIMQPTDPEDNEPI
jgi:hypothetical protein